MNNELIQLVTVKENKKNASGFKIGEEVSWVDIFAEVKSVGRTEFYEAARSGLKVDIIFSVNPDDFEMAAVLVGDRKIKPSRVIYDGTTYLIERTYKKDLHVLEITCKEVE